MNLRDSGRPWYKERWPWILMVGPAVVIVAGIATAWLAVRSNDGLVSDDYYKEGLAINQRLHRDREASEMGLHADLMRADMNIRLLLNLNGNEQLPQELTLKLMHPTQAGQDQLVKLKAESSGFYSGKLSAALSGRWLVSVEDPAGNWRLQGEWQSDADGPLRLSARLEN